MRTQLEGLRALHAALRTEGGTLGEALVAPPGARAAAVAGLDAPGPAQVAASGPRPGALASEYELLVEMILEGYRLHYGEAHLVRAADPDLALLLGDQLYALGLERLAALGDRDAVGELADIISLVAQAHAEADPERAQAIWDAGAVALGWGATPAHEAAKARARLGDRLASAELRAAAHRDGR